MFVAPTNAEKHGTSKVACVWPAIHNWSSLLTGPNDIMYNDVMYNDVM